MPVFDAAVLTIAASHSILISLGVFTLPGDLHWKEAATHVAVWVIQGALSISYGYPE